MRAASVVLVLALSLSPARAGEVTAQDSLSIPVAQPSPAQLRASEIDRLFGQLHRLKQPGSGAVIEAKIAQLWMASDSPTAEVLLQQATAALEAGDSDPSLELLNRVTARYPDWAEAWNKRATVLYNLGRYDESLADIDKVLALEPRHYGALAGRGMIFAQQKKYAAARAALQEALAINPQMPDVLQAVKELGRLQRSL